MDFKLTAGFRIFTGIFSLATTSRGRVNDLVNWNTRHDRDEGQNLRRGKRGCFEKRNAVEDWKEAVVDVVARVGPVKEKSRVLLIIKRGIGPVAAQAVEIIAVAFHPWLSIYKSFFLINVIATAVSY